MRGCWTSFILSFIPRVVVLGFWIFTDYVTIAFKNVLMPFNYILPALGLLLFPLTTLAYIYFYSFWQPGVSTLEWVLIVIALLIDLGSYGTTAPQFRRRFYNI